VSRAHAPPTREAREAAAADHAVDARGVRKVFGKGALAFEALKGVDLQARRGEFVMLAGPSGSGKTTLLSILGCVLSPTSGDVRLCGEDVSRLHEDELPRIRTEYIGFIFQGNNLIASLTTEQNVALQLELRGVRTREALDEARGLLDKVGLADKIGRKPMDLSGGQRQRVAIARALAGDPPVILADEPTAALDAENGRHVTEILRALARERGTTVVVVTHDNRIFHLAARIVHIEDGHITGAEPAPVSAVPPSHGPAARAQRPAGGAA
jgi:putative ABC transport system ATP-binding protein